MVFVLCASMSLFRIQIDKVVIQHDDKKIDEILNLLREISNEKAKQEIMDKLTNSIEDLKKTV